MPTLAQPMCIRWANVGPTKHCYLGHSLQQEITVIVQGKNDSLRAELLDIHNSLRTELAEANESLCDELTGINDSLRANLANNVDSNRDELFNATNDVTDESNHKSYSRSWL